MKANVRKMMQEAAKSNGNPSEVRKKAWFW
jgi:hypothetical protein